MMIFDITIAAMAERIDAETRWPAIVGNCFYNRKT